MNEKAFDVAYQYFTSTGYNGSPEDFSKLLKSNEKAFNISFDYFKDTGYNGDKSKFSTMLGVDFDDETEPEITTPEVKGETPPADVPVEGEDGASTGEDDSTVTPEVDWKSPELKGKWNYTSDDIGQSIWNREYEVENKDGSIETVSEIVPTNSVPKEVLQQWEQSSKVGDEIEGGQQGQSAWEFVAGKKDAKITTAPVMENVANFKANVQETEEIKNNISSEIELWKEDQVKIKELNNEVKSTPSVVIPNVGQLPLGPDGELPEFYNQEAQKEAQKQTTIRQRILNKRTETEKSIKNSRLGNYLKQANELWPENEPISNRTDEWLYETATQLMQTDDEQGLMDKKIAEYMEDNQGILQVMKPEWANKEVEKAKEYKESLTKKQVNNLTQQNFLADDIKNSDTKIKDYENTLNNIDYSNYESKITEWDKQISALGDVDGNSSQEAIDEYNRLNVERNKVVKNYEVDFESNKKLYQDYTNEVSNRKKSYQSYLNTVNLDTEFNQQGTDLVNYTNAMNRNGHNIPAALTWVTTSALHMASGIEGAINAVAELPEDLLFEYYDGDINKMPEAVKMIYAIDGVKDVMRNVKKDTFNKFVEDMNTSVQTPTQYEDIDNLSDLGAFGMNVIANFVPQYGLMYATGGASIYIMGGSAFGNKYDQMEFTNRQGLQKTDYTLGQKWLASGIAFGSEVVSESFTYGVFKAKNVGLSKLSYDRVKNAFGKGVYETSKRVGKRTVSNLPYMYQESVSETFAELGNNFGDKYVLGKDISLGQGLKGAALSGLFMERAMSMPTLYQDVSSLFAGKTYKQKIAENNNKRIAKEKLLANPDLALKTREKLEDDVLKLVAQNETLMAKNIENIDMMSNKEKEDLVKLDTEIIELRATEDAINADESLDNNQKETLIDDIRTQEAELLDQQDDIIVEYESDETRDKKKERYDKQLKQIKDKINKFNRRRAKNLPSSNRRGRVKIFKTREEQQAFFNDMITQENALNQAEINAWKEILKDPSKLNEADRNAIGLEDGDVLLDTHVNDIKSIIKGIENKIEFNSYDSQIGAKGYGAFKGDSYGGFDIYINEENSLRKGGRINTAAHELLHAILYQSIGEDAETQASLGNAVKDFILDNKGGFNRKFIRRMEPYQGDSEFGEEIITIMSESIMDGTLDYNEGLFTKFGDLIRQHLQRLGLRDITFDSGKDVYNFIKDYNASIEKGYDSIAIEEMMDKGAKGKLLRKTQKGRGNGTVMKSKAASDKVQRIYEEQGESGAFEIIEEFKPIVSRITEKRREAPNFDRELLMSEIEIGERGILDLISKYDPKSGVPLAAYINTYLPARAIEASRRVLGETFTEDVSEKVDIAAEEVEIEVKAKPKKKKIILSDRLGVKNKVDKAIEEKLPKLNIENLNFKTLKDQTPEITGEMFGISPKKLISGANITKGELQSAQMFISKNADILLAMLPEGTTAGGTATGVPQTLLKAFYTKTDRAKMAKTGTKAGLAVQVKNNNISKSDFLEVFGIVDGVPNRTDRNTSARVLALANQTGKMMTNQAIREQLSKENTPLITKHIARISDGKNSIMFSKDDALNTNQNPTLKDVFGGINSLLSKKEQTLFHDNILQFVSTYVGVNEAKMSDTQKNEILLTEDVDAIEIALRNTYGNNISKETLEAIAKQIVKTVSKLKISPKSKNVVKQEKIVEAIIKSTEDSAKKIAKFTGSNITAQKAQDDLVRQEHRRKSDSVFFDNKFKQNPEQAIADLIMLGGHSHTSGKIGSGGKGRGRGQYYKNVKDYYDYHLGNVNIIPVYKTFKRDGKLVYELDVKATASKNGLKDILVTRAAQSSSAAIKDHKNTGSLKERRKHEKHARIVLNEYVAHNVARYKKGLQDNIDIMLMMDSLLSNMNSVLARAAKLEYIELGVAAKDARYEHMQPRVATLIRLVDAHINRGGVENIDTFLTNYDVAIINKGFDKAITNAGYQYTLADGQSFDDSSLIRYYNDKTLTDKRLGLVVEIGTNKIPKLVESFAKANKLLKPKLKEFNRFNKAINKNRMMMSKPSQGITVLDFDDTLATSKSLVISTSPDGVVRKLTAEEFAQEGADLLDQGWTHDFSEFSKVVDGKVASLFKKAMKLQGKFGSENMFVLTARPAESAPAIFEFLKANGLNIPLKNITGLANSTPESKALWIADKVAEGYNDFYFADDALQNVQAVDNMLEQFDVKRKVQQAKIKFSKSMDTDFNNILENVTGIESDKRFSAIKARKRGAEKGKFRFFIPPSHEDFVGLLYNFMGKGKEGNAHRDFWEKSLVRPLNRAYRELDTAKQSIANDYKSLNKQFDDVKKKLTKKTPDGDFTHQDAIRIYLWNKHGYKVPGLSPSDQTKLVELVNSDANLRAYAETLNVISKQDAYVNPTESWEGGDIRTDLDDATGRVGRDQYFAEFNENAEIIFSQDNLNKIEAAYGEGVVNAIKDVLYRTKTGRNRPSGQNQLVNRFMNYLNGSVGSVMFFNMRSALLQQMSIVNFINFADNNVFSAAKAFANQKQYWTDWAYIFNSDMIKQRRGGIKTDINGAELAASLRGAKNTPRALVAKLLELGFLPTQIGDNIAIASGGATFYRNRINTYLTQGMTQKEAQAKAWTDFQVLAESTQQSARPDMVSQQQASPLGKIVLAFQNVTSQFNRLGKKAFLDIKNRRITPGNTSQFQSDVSNTSRIAYYFAIQNLIFYTLQTALFAAMFDDDEEDERLLKKKERILNGTLDSVLRGSGVFGAIVSTLKNMGIKFAEQRNKGWNKDESSVLIEALNLSPPLGIKGRKITNAEKTLNYNKDVIKEMETFDIDNPVWSAVTNYIEAFTNVPVNRLYNKTQNIREALNNQNSTLQRALMFLGWSKYNLGIEDVKIQEVKEIVKEKKKVISKEKSKIKREEKKKVDLKEKEAKGVEKQKKEKKEGKQVTCLVCKLPIESGKKYCTVHEKTVQRKDGKKVQCRKRKKDGKRCGMQTSSKSGYCYYHD